MAHPEPAGEPGLSLVGSTEALMACDEFPSSQVTVEAGPSSHPPPLFP